MEELVARYQSDIRQILYMLERHGFPLTKDLVMLIARNIRERLVSMAESEKSLRSFILQICFLSTLAMGPPPLESFSPRVRRVR